MIWLIFTVLVLGAMGIALAPLRQREKALVLRGETVPAILVDQLEEVDRDLDRGIISEVEAKAARQEIRRRMALALRRSETGTSASNGGQGAIILAAVFVPLMAIGYYAIAGAPETTAMPPSIRGAVGIDEERIADLTQKLRDKLTSDADGGATEGWMLLGQTYGRMGRFDDAVEALQIAANRADANSATWSMLAEALIRTSNGTVTPAAAQALRTALELDETNPAATFYLAIADYQSGEAATAHERLLRRLYQTEGYRPWMDSYVAQANAIAKEIDRPGIDVPVPDSPGPSAADIASAQDMSKEDRADFIRSMVDRLANRLEEEPGDVEGWLRLAKAYEVLKEHHKAKSAYLRAEERLPADDPRMADVRERLRELEEN
ncbi:c-type cytochrome biogenesis protein CcmI [Pseudooceanicola nitratireducens]|uniref:c-type cytochrome biogenesis protein CcmI n=1 Tax=Pseudooceanicola nitratireducens TaxID=517719 RepID=UPI0035110A14